MPRKSSNPARGSAVKTAQKLQTAKIPAARKPRGKPFKKGYDPRRNLKGVPADAIRGRHFIRNIGAELVDFKDDYGEGKVTRLYLMIRGMYASRNPKDKEILLKAQMPGLLRDDIEIKSDDKPLATPIVKIYLPSNNRNDKKQ
jgi:hypothetical protein